MFGNKAMEESQACKSAEMRAQYVAGFERSSELFVEYGELTKEKGKGRKIIASHCAGKI